MIDANMSRADYDALQAWNFSRLRVLAQSPKHFAHAAKFGSTDSAARKFGRVIHLAVLEPEVFESRIAVWESRTAADAMSPRKGAKWDAFVAANQGKELITPDERREAIAIANALHEDEDAAPLLSGGQSEVSIGWELDGFKMKSRLDYKRPKQTIELKKTRNASPTAFPWDAEKFRYHGQAAFQRDGVLLATGEISEHVIIAVEDFAPYASVVYRYGEAEIAEGRAEYQRWLAMLAECQKTGKWHGYTHGPVSLELPRASRRWAVMEDAE